MTQARPKPLVGALLGLLLGLVTMALLTVLGILPPDRLPLFAVVALAVLLSAALLTQRMSIARGRLITVMVISALLGGFALTGIPEIMRGGSTSSACLATATSSLETDPVAPSSTSAIDPFRVTPSDTLAWSTSTDAAVTQADARLSLMVGGFAIPLRNATFAEAPDLTQWNGETSVESQLESIRDASGMHMTGTYHFAATADTDGGECEGNAYIRIEPTGTFDGLLLVLLWSLLAILVVTILVLAIGVRRSIRDSDATLAMVGTSAIPGGTSTTPPPEPRREAKPRSDSAAGAEGARDDGDRRAGAADDRDSRGGSGRTDTDSSDSGRDDRGSGGRDDRGRSGAGSDASSADGDQLPPNNDEDATPPTDDGGQMEPEPHEDGLARSPYAADDPEEPVEEAVPADDTPPLEEREQVTPPDEHDLSTGDGAEHGADTPTAEPGTGPDDEREGRPST